jgi:hypothetical protein
MAGRRFADALGVSPEEAEGKSLLQLIAGAGWNTGEVHPRCVNWWRGCGTGKILPVWLYGCM